MRRKKLEENEESKKLPATQKRETRQRKVKVESLFPPLTFFSLTFFLSLSNTTSLILFSHLTNCIVMMLFPKLILSLTSTVTKGNSVSSVNYCVFRTQEREREEGREIERKERPSFQIGLKEWEERVLLWWNKSWLSSFSLVTIQSVFCNHFFQCLTLSHHFFLSQSLSLSLSLSLSFSLRLHLFLPSIYHNFVILYLIFLSFYFNEEYYTISLKSSLPRLFLSFLPQILSPAL